MESGRPAGGEMAGETATDTIGERADGRTRLLDTAEELLDRHGRWYVPERDAFAEVAVYDGHRMRCGHRIAGPALVEQQTTAIFVSDAFDCVVDALGSFVLFAKGRDDLLGRAARAPQEASA